MKKNIITKKELIMQKQKFSTQSRLLTEPQDDDSSDGIGNPEIKVEHKRTFYSDIRKQTIKYLFDINKIFTVPDNLTEQDENFKERVNLSDEKKELVSDLKKVKKGKIAIDKVYHNVTPKPNEFKAFKFIKDKYQDFFDDDIESTEPAQELNDLSNYISGELRNNHIRHKKLKNIMGQHGKTLENKRKLETVVSSDEESTSSKKSRQTPGEFIDDLPTDHNPFDDAAE